MNWFLTAFAEGMTDMPAEGNILGIIFQFLPLILIFGLMYVILILPQKRREKKTREMINQAIVGDKVISIGGIAGKIVNIKDDEFTIESGTDRTKVTVKKWAIKEVDKPISE